MQSTEAREFATAALRLVLEVVDRRRGASTLAHLLSPAVVGMAGALAIANVPGRHLGVAVLQRVHVSVVAANHAEIFGTYTRGDRVFAIAAGARYRRSAGRAPSWSMTSLRLS
ncbi:Rv3235 family protein [Actinomycetes bacterium M1A6_2h]